MPMLLATNNVKPIMLLNTVVAAFEWLNAGFLICNASGQLLFANEAGHRILESADGLTLDEAGRVIAVLPGSTARGDSVVDFPVALATAQKRRGLIVSVVRTSGRLPLTLILRPTQLAAWSRNPEASPILVLIHEPDLPVNASLPGLRELFGLTPTEARLAHLMMQGKTTEECTTELGIRRTTLKMHLRNLYGKTGVQRQGELVALLYKSFGNIRCRGFALPRIAKLVSSGDQSRIGPIFGGERAAC